jgi:hypothetical protein
VVVIWAIPQSTVRQLFAFSPAHPNLFHSISHQIAQITKGPIKLFNDVISQVNGSHRIHNDQICVECSFCSCLPIVVRSATASRSTMATRVDWSWLGVVEKDTCSCGRLVGLVPHPVSNKIGRMVVMRRARVLSQWNTDTFVRIIPLVAIPSRLTGN